MFARPDGDDEKGELVGVVPLREKGDPTGVRAEEMELREVGRVETLCRGCLIDIWRDDGLISSRSNLPDDEFSVETLTIEGDLEWVRS